MKNIIEINHLYKSYKDVKAVFDLSFKVKEGEFFSFLGVNGAGKSTTISIMCGSVKKDKGDVLIDGLSIDEYKEEITRKIGVVFQNSYLDKELTVYENLKYRAALYGIYGKEFKDRLAELSKLFNISDYMNRPLKKCSGGQKRKIDIIRALIHKPKILILDEPTTGLDPQTRAIVWKNINSLRKKQGLTVFLTTHYMEEASFSDYVVILDKGVIIKEGTPHQLKTNYTKDYIMVYNVEEDKIKELNYPFEKITDGFKIFVNNTNEAKELIIKYSDLFNDFEIFKGNMDDVFLNVTGKSLSGGEL